MDINPIYTEWRKKDGLFFPYDSKNEILLLSHGFVEVESFCHSVALVSDGKKWGCIDNSGKVIVSIKYDTTKVKEYDEGHFHIICGRDGVFCDRIRVNDKYIKNGYTGVYDLYNIDGELLIGGFDEYVYLPKPRLFCFLFGRKWEISEFWASKVMTAFSRDAKWLVLNEYFCFPSGKDKMKGKIFEWKILHRKKIAGAYFTDNGNFNGTLYSSDANDALFIDLPDRVLFDKVEECKWLLHTVICEKNNRYCVINVDERSNSSTCHRISQYYKNVDPFDDTYTCVLEDYNIGLVRYNELVLACDYTHITRPVNDWIFAIKPYPYYPESQFKNCYFALLLNIKDASKYRTPFQIYDALVAVKKIEGEDLEKMLNDGVFRLYSINGTNKGIQSITVKEEFLKFFSEEFCESIGDSRKIDGISILLSHTHTHKDYWKSSNLLLKSLEIMAMHNDLQYEDSNSIWDALEYDPDAYWNID